jgi:hypothetical protein
MTMMSGRMPIPAFYTAMTALALSTGAQAQRAATAPRPLTFDVAGVKLGMSPDEAKASLARLSYKVTRISEVPSFDQEVRAEAARRQGRSLPNMRDAGVSRITAIGPHQEYIEVHFLQQPDGSRVGGVTVDVPTTAITREAFWRQVEAKYGAAGARRQSVEMSWCSVEVGDNCGRSYVASGPMETDYPLLTASSYAVGGGRLWLQAGQRAHDAQAAIKEAATVRLAPKTDKAAF